MTFTKLQVRWWWEEFGKQMWPVVHAIRNSHVDAHTPDDHMQATITWYRGKGGD